MSKIDIKGVRPMRIIFWLLCLMIVAGFEACGGDKSASISSGSPGEGGSIKISAQAILAQAAKGNYKEGELLVKFKSGTITTASEKVHKATGSSVLQKYDIVPNLELVKLPKGVAVQDALRTYLADPNVEYAEPNYTLCASAVPNDPYLRNQWSLQNNGTYAGGTPGADIKAPLAWDIATGSDSVVIAVLDTGVDYTHDDLARNIWRNFGETDCSNNYDDDGNGYRDDCYGWNFVDGNNDPMDYIGHGTHVAGIIGAVGNNLNGISGVMWNVKLMPLKILGSQDEGEDSCTSGYVSDEIAALQYIADAINRGINVKVINASYRQYAFCNAELDAVYMVNGLGVMFVAAAGNETMNNDVTPAYPASYPVSNIISVAVTDQDDKRVPFSNYGVNTVHVAAPGVYTFSTVPYGLDQMGYGILEFMEGTSMAAPHVAGLAGLLFSYYDGVQNTYFNYLQVRDTILRYVDRLPTLDGWIRTGGRINAYRALSSLLAPTNLKAKATSSSVSLTWTDNATGEDGYVVERSTSGGPYGEIAYLPTGASSFRDSNVVGQTTYSYRVKAYNNIAASFYSNEESVTVPRKSGGGGGCSIGGQQNTGAALANVAVLLVPFIFVTLMRRRR